MRAWTQPQVPSLNDLGLGTNSEPLKLRGVDGEKHTVEPRDEMSLYVCGITPYDATHMGHAATYLAFDTLNRLWRDTGAKVVYAQNVTDVDDPLLERANATGQDWTELAARETQLFREDMSALNVIAPDHYVGVVDSIDLISDAVRELVDQGHAYRLDDGTGDIYFDSAAANPAWHLGEVSGLDEARMETLFAERGGDPDRAGKRNPLDPLLWRGARDGEPSWDGGSLGRGRPGWHIECSAIASAYLPQPFTVQGGGSDLIFPHHEFSSAHASIGNAKAFAEHFAHAGMVGLDGEKMSKSLGNLVLVSTLRKKGVDPRAIRLAVLRHHYRDDWSWTDAQLQQAVADIAAWERAAPHIGEVDAHEAVAAMRRALADDLDTPTALAVVDEVMASVGASGNAQGQQAGGGAVLKAALDALLGIRLA